jgi:hemolysin activation/secretion protein
MTRRPKRAKKAAAYPQIPSGAALEIDPSFPHWLGMLGAVALSGFGATASAQNVDAGRVFESLQKKDPSVTQPGAPRVDVKPGVSPAGVMPIAGSQLEVKQFRVEGARLLAQPKLEALVQPYAGRTLTVSQLQEAADIVTQAYRDAGYTLAQALVLPQTIQDGTVVITVREGGLERLDLAAAGVSVLPGVARASLQQAARVGEPVNTFTLEEALLLVNDLPGRGRASAEIAPGSQSDSSVISIAYAPAQRWGGALLADNAGNRFTGRGRVLASVYMNEPFGAGDQLSVTALTSGSPLWYGQAGYRVPVSVRTTLGLSLSKLKYELCCQPVGTVADGAVSAWGLDVAHNLVLQRGRNAALVASIDGKQLKTGQNGLNQTDRKVQALSAGARGYSSDTALRSWAAALRTGKADLGDNPADLAADASGARVQGQFAKLSGSFYRTQALNTAWSWLVNFRGQVNVKRNLESSERFALGGADGVRAYPSGEGVGDSGWLGSLEVRYAFAAAPGMSLAGFMDAGGVKRFTKNAAQLLGAEPNTYELAGLGLGLRYEQTAGNLQLSVARPVGSNRGVDVAGNNNEGRRDGTRAWFSAAWRF